MNSNSLLGLISKAKSDLKSYRDEYETQPYSKSTKHTEYVLHLMQIEIQSNESAPLNMNPRVFRGYKDICAVAVKAYENTNLERSLLELSKALEDEIPEYKNLGPLRMDFGKQDPI